MFVFQSRIPVRRNIKSIRAQVHYFSFSNANNFHILSLKFQKDLEKFKNGASLDGDLVRRFADFLHNSFLPRRECVLLGRRHGGRRLLQLLVIAF